MSCLTNIHKEAEVGEWEVIDNKMFIWNEIVNPNILNERFIELLRLEGVIE